MRQLTLLSIGRNDRL